MVMVPCLPSGMVDVRYHGSPLAAWEGGVGRLNIKYINLVDGQIHDLVPNG